MQKLREALTRVWLLELFFSKALLSECKTPSEEAFTMLQHGEWLIGEDDDSGAQCLVAYVPSPVQPVQRIYLYDVTSGGRGDLVDSLCNYVFEGGAHKIKLAVANGDGLEAYGFRLVGAQALEAWTKEGWVDILLFEKLNPSWAESTGEVIESSAKKVVERKRNVRTPRKKSGPRNDGVGHVSK